MGGTDNRLVVNLNRNRADDNGQENNRDRRDCRQRGNRDFFNQMVAELDPQAANTAAADDALDFAEKVYTDGK